MTLEELKQITEDYFGLEINPVDRKAENVRVRFAYYHTAHRIFPLCSLREMALAGQTHATVLNAIKEFPNIVRFDPHFKIKLKGYYDLIEVDEKEVNFAIPEYDEIHNKIKSLVSKSARDKIKLLKRENRRQKLQIERLKNELKYTRDAVAV